MKTNNLPPCLTFGISHSKEYKPSVIANYLVDKDSDGNFIKRHSDAFLLLRQKKLQETIGTEAIRAYLDQMRQNAVQSVVPHDNLSDKELFALIEPKEVNNITTAYEFAKYLKDNSDKVKAKHKELADKKQQMINFNKKYGLKQ